jgi:multidrug efflux pump subunit AcrB
MRRSNGIIEQAMRYNQITLLIVGLAVVLGVYGLIEMPKQEFPDFTIRQGVVVGVYPGATSAEVEEQLAKPLEHFLYTYKEIKRNKTYSMSRDGIVYVMVELNDNINEKDRVWSKIKLGLQNFKMQLPSGVLALMAKDDFGDTSALLISIESEDKTYRELQNYVEELEDQLRPISSVSNLRRYGEQKEQISIYVDRDKLSVYNINNNLLMAELLTQGFSVSGGKIEGKNADMPIYVSDVYDSEKEIEEQIILTQEDGTAIRLKDVAKVVREYPTPDSYIMNNGKKCIILSMEMRSGNNIVEYGKEVDEVLGKFQQNLPDSVSIRRIADQPKVVGDSVYSFLRDLLIAILVVIIVMMILFPFKSAIVAATSIPISMFISIGLMYLCGIPLNTVTLAALIVVLGMIVDNSIIVIDAYLERLDNGMSRWHAAISSAKDYFSSIFIATLCICIIFYPLLFTLTGMFHDFVLFFPWTITISLMSSLIVAMVFIPLLEYFMIKTGLKTGQKEKAGRSSFNMLDAVQKGYEWVLRYTFKHPRRTLLAGIGFVILPIYMLSFLKTRMMPIADRDQFAVEIYLPYGSTLEQTGEVADSVYHLLAKDDRILSVTSFVGTSSPRFQTTYAPNIADKNYAQFIVNTASIAATEEVLDDYTNKYANYFANAFVKFKQLDYQQASIPIEIRFKGEHIEDLKTAAEQLMEPLRKIDDLTWVHTNYEQSLPNVTVQLKPIDAARLGLSKTRIASEIAVNFEGISVGNIWEGDYNLPVKLKTLKKNKYDKPTDVENVYVSTRVPGVSVPVRQIATVKANWNDAQIVRRNGVRSISVYAQPKRHVNDTEALKQVTQILENEVVPNLPEGVEYEYGGAREHDMEIIPQIASGLIVAVIIVFFFLLQNYKKIGLSLGALVSLSLCLFGAVLGLWLTNNEFGITCILGVISLIGIIVRNVIMIFDHAQDLRMNHRYGVKEAAMDAGKRRMLPIFLTSATTAVGVIPMILGGSSLWAPMGIVIFFGTIFSMLLVVCIVPVFYWRIILKS